jgi:hypothetical protein
MADKIETFGHGPKLLAELAAYGHPVFRRHFVKAYIAWRLSDNLTQKRPPQT